MLTFPPSPAVNDLFPVPVVPGTPQWQWDGVKWVALGAAAGLADAPSDGSTYGRKDGAWDAVVSTSAPASRVLLVSQSVVPAAPVATVEFFYDFATNRDKFDHYVIDIYNLQVTTSNNFGARLSWDGVTFDASGNYTWASIFAIGNNTGAFAGTFSATYLPITQQTVDVGNYPAMIGQVEVRFSMPWTTDRNKYFFSDSIVHAPSGVTRGMLGAGHVIASGWQPIAGFNFFPAAGGNIVRGVFDFYGIHKGAGGV